MTLRMLQQIGQSALIVGGWFILVMGCICLVSLELELRKHLTIKTTLIDKKIMESLIENDDVGFYWTMVAINWTEEVQLISELWITIRGFSHVSSFVSLSYTNKKDKRHCKSLKA